MGRPSKEQQDQRRRELGQKQLSFAVWLATPPAGREPATYQDLATVLGVSYQTLWRWERDPRVMEASRFIVLQQAASPDKVAAILDMLHESALAERDVKRAEVWLKASGVMSAHQRNGHLASLGEGDVPELADFSVEALEEMKAAMAAAEAEAERVREARARLGS